MRKRLLNILKCPNGGNEPMQIFAFKARRGDTVINNIDGENLMDNDDVISGIIISKASSSVYIIEEFIGVILADEDVNPNYLENKLSSIGSIAPLKYKKVISLHLERIKLKKLTSDGKWNSEEMGYYDKSVEDRESRTAMLKDIRENPIWRIFIPREKHITSFISATCQNQIILEIGSGNSRTIANIFRPKDRGYQYVGSDISFKRLLVAKEAIPEGDFLQASAMNLPFADNSFQAILSFGMLHHLPRPIDCIDGCIKKIKIKGFLCFHEPIIKPILFGNMTSFLSKYFTTYEHSKHDNDLHLSNAMSLLLAKKFEIVKHEKLNSPFRTLIEFILLKWTPKRFCMNKFVVKTFFIIDNLVINTVSRVWKKFGPHGAIVVAKKI